jgi:DNA-binding NarL/FixJ family response regulator
MTRSVDTEALEVLIICVMVAQRVPGDVDGEPRWTGQREGRAQTPDDRVAELEARLRRIGAELKAAGIMDDLDSFPSLTDHPRVAELTSRQREILVRLLNAQRVSVIAAELFVSPSTVRNHLMTIFTKFRVHSQAELLARLRTYR